ncbi:MULTISPECIES: DUF418 domain-containing protein YeiB [Yersinia pseudotuberculosis complex]|uniref:Putative membrane protein n=1 Tax=Yersinia pseudotuberculosis serotype O:1b (strain IP 31758) TaxID=349747 RepID=A0A0U1R0R3_YERP3|nr:MULTISPECIES: DUF418 domain-containing protein YeiB [Yersinia pseudotuberculosis complex]ABS48726.1 putative membrane protein [Yersinia pseudotuberculosis IP 31758]MCE4113014.1 DUF418 family protein [Yersinia pseudotuberculosis]MCF1162865.1 DUF418 family protein [Yersinia pseudotuberculosis]RYC28341.1 DUF418 family protein [Yersinia pseudotuberculosis]UFA62159.1 DUF418 domain-containing protein [Yersinia pseudotuberculosis]
MRQRIATLDSARGLVILGILLLNISAFGLPKAAYLNPAYLGLPSLSDIWTWAILDIVAQVKFLSIFAMLFGAGLELLLKRGKSWVRARLSLLLLLGLIHGIFFWDGDILLAYSLIGLVCWRIIQDAKDAASLLRTGAVLYLIGVAVLLLLGYITRGEPGRFWLPGPADLQYEQFWKLQGGGEAWRNRLGLLSSNLIAIGAQYGWELAGSMVFGAGLMRCGWLRGEFSLRHYRRLALFLISLSLVIQIPGVALQVYVGWDYRWAGFLLQVPRELGAPLQAVGYLALLYGFWPTLSRWAISHWLAKVGRMALSNYLLQTLICTLIFYHFGLYQQLDRLQLLAVVPLVWACNVIFSLLWLRYFVQGPVEWLWRRLTAYACGQELQIRNTKL